MSIDKKAMEIKRMGNSSSLHQSWAPHPTVVSGAGSGLTVPTWSATEDGSGCESTPAERLSMRDSESISGDAVPASPGIDVCGGRRQVADAEAWEWVSVRTTRGFAAYEGKHSVQLEVTPVGTRRRRAVGITKSSGSEDRNILRCITGKPAAVLDVILLCSDLQICFYFSCASSAATRSDSNGPCREQSSV